MLNDLVPTAFLGIFTVKKNSTKHYIEEKNPEAIELHYFQDGARMDQVIFYLKVRASISEKQRNFPISSKEEKHIRGFQPSCQNKNRFQGELLYSTQTKLTFFVNFLLG